MTELPEEAVGLRILRLLAVERGLQDEGQGNAARLFRAAALGAALRATHVHLRLGRGLEQAATEIIAELRAVSSEGLAVLMDQVLATAPAPALAPPTDGPIRILVSRTRPPELATRLAELLGAELVPMGSAGAKTTAVVLGTGDVYAHGGGQYEWDSAAPVGVAAAAGCHCSRLDGSPLRYNQPDPYLPDLLVCRPELADRVLAAIAQASGRSRGQV